MENKQPLDVSPQMRGCVECVFLRREEMNGTVSENNRKVLLFLFCVEEERKKCNLFLF